MDAGEFGCITSPMQGNLIPAKAVWCADNGRFGRGWPGRDRYLRWLDTLEPAADRCQFVVLPDVPFDMPRSLELSMSYLPDLARTPFPIALALQNGAEDMELPWGEIQAVFIAGDDQWKLGHAAVTLIHEALTKNLWTHLARVNSARRWRFACGVGADSSDGTFFSVAPDKNLARQRRWHRRETQGVLI